jgi:hypothetical protein
MNARDDKDLLLVLRHAEQLVAAANVFALTLEDLEAINLPPASPVDIDQAQLRAIASLYLASELENAGVIPAAEALARLAMSGSLNVNMGDAAALIQAFWKQRNSRTSDSERMGFFAALFGAAGASNDTARGRNADFEDLLIDLCEALYKLDEQASNPSWGSVAQQARVRSASQSILHNLLHVSGGITVFMGKEILTLIRQTLSILGHPAVKAAFRAQSVWDVIDEIDRRMRRPLREHSLFVRRGQAGMTILAWLADAAPLLSSNKPLVGLDHPVIPAAVEWLEASLSLGQTAQTASPAPDAPSWAELAG